MSSRFTMRNLFQSLRTKSASHDATKRPNRARTLRLEALESRELLDAAGYHGAIVDSNLIPTVVTTVADVVNDNDGHISLREAIDAAGGANNSSTVTFAPEVIGQVISLRDTLEISKGVTIDAWTVTSQNVVPGQNSSVTVSDSASLPAGSYSLAGKHVMSMGVTLDGADFVYNSSENQPIVNVKDVSNGKVTITGVTITNSNPNPGTKSSLDGVGLLIESSRVELRNSVISGLHQHQGGAVVVKSSASSDAELPVFIATNVLIVDNKATNNESSAVEVHDVSHVTFYNCTIAHNNVGASTRYGISIKNDGDDYAPHVVFFNSILVENSDVSEVTVPKRAGEKVAFAYCVLGKLAKPPENKHDIWTGDVQSKIKYEDWNADSDAETVYHYNTDLFVDIDHGNYCLKNSTSNSTSNVAIGGGKYRVVTDNSGASVNFYGYTHSSGETAGYAGFDITGGYDLAGNQRVYDGKVDIGAFGTRNGNNPVFYTMPDVYVTISGDTVNHADDFNADGSANKISLREAVWYINRYYVGGDPNSESSWSNPVSDANVDPQTGQLSNGDIVWKVVRFKDFDSAHVFGEGEEHYLVVNLASSISSDKTFTIEGVTKGDSHDHNTKKVLINGSSAGIFQITSGTITANNLTLKGNANSAVTNGGAVNITGGSVTYSASSTPVANGYVANGGAFIGNIATNYGGAVYVDAGARFIANDYVTRNANGEQLTESVEFKNNEALRGGAICNLGTVTINGSTSFTDNAATGKKQISDTDNYTGSFGGAIYNAGTLNIGSANSGDRVTFNGNNAGKTDESDLAFKNGVLNGYSGGAIYNTSVKVNGVTHTGNVEAYNVDFENNFAGKYGGAISNFATLTVENATFKSNVASAGGAVQTAGGTSDSPVTFTNATFTDNTAYKSKVALATSDNGGNGGAIFASGEGKSVTFKGATKFDGNKAANAGGAIDYISGSLAFDKNGFTTTATNPKCLIVTNNTARTIGGAMVLAGAVNFTGFATDGTTDGTTDVTITGNSVGTVADSVDAFHKDTGDDGGVFAPVVAVTYNVGDAAIQNIGTYIFGSSDPDRTSLDTFARYSVTAYNTIGYEDLVGAFPSRIDSITVKYKGNEINLERGGNTTITLDSGSNIVYYKDSSQVGWGDNVIVYKSNILVDNTSSLSVVMSQFDLTDREYIANSQDGALPNALAMGVSVQICSSKPVSEWVLNWGDTKTSTVNSYGFTCNAYHLYSAAGAYNLTLTVDSKSYDLGEFVVKASTSSEGSGESETGNGAAILDAEADFFADLDLVDELFED